MSELKNKTLSGIFWSVATQIIRQVVQFIISIVLIRLLLPEEFGLVGMVTVVTGFVIIFRDFGLGSAIIHKKEVSQADLSTAFWFNIMVGAALTLIIIGVAPFVAEFYNEPILTDMTMVLAFNFLISSFSIVQSSIFAKKIDFKTLFFVRITTTIVSGSIAIIMAVNGYGVWSIVAQSLSMSLVSAIGLWVASKWRPSFVFSKASLKMLLDFGLALLGTRTLNYWARNTDNLLIGKFLGSNQLGIYSKAYSVMLLPLTNISQVLSRVMFPSLSTIQDDKQRVKRIYLRMTRSIALVTFPMMAGLIVTADPFVLVVFGEKWKACIPILKILSVLGLTQSIGTLNGNIFLSQGATKLQLKIGLITKPMMIVGIVIGLQWGIIGVAIGYLSATLLSGVLEFYKVGQLIETTIKEMVVNLLSVLGCAAAMALAIFGLNFFLADQLAMKYLLLVDVFAGICVYLALVLAFRIKAYTDLKDTLMGKFKK